MELQNSPPQRWAAHRYEDRQREWHRELLSNPPDWSELEELHQELLSLEAYLTALGMKGWL